MDHTSIHPSCTSLAHRVDLHLWRGAPENLDADRPVQILVNDGYVVGFSPARLQPAWSAYRVAGADQAVDYDRPLTYYDDMRLPAEHRIGAKTFGKLGGVQLNVGHMTPNEAINQQYGRLAQLETFLMSNMSPQYGSLNRGVWLKLETAIREIRDEPGSDHVWAIVGPIFGDQPASINRGHGKYMPVPDSYFCIICDPHTYPYNTLSRVDLNCYVIPQTAPPSSDPLDYPATLAEIQAATRLEFFAGWGREQPTAALAYRESRGSDGSRITRVLERHRAEQRVADAAAVEAGSKASSIDDLVDTLKAEAAQIEIQARALTEEEQIRLRMIQHTISWLLRAKGIASPTEDKPEPPTLITYNIVRDLGDKLKLGARTACNFWNHFIQPRQSIVIRLGTFTQNSTTIARAYEPYAKDNTRYGVVEFNTKYLADFTDREIAGTIVHEIGHTLGIGWHEPWSTLFDPETGRFTDDAVGLLAALADMEVERDGGRGTALAHWDEERFGKELMTGYQNAGEHVLPVTIDLMSVLGHTISTPLEAETPLAELLDQVARVTFSRQDEVVALNLEHYEKTDLWETIPHRPAGA